MRKVYQIFIFAFFVSALCSTYAYGLGSYLYDSTYPYEYYGRESEPKNAKVSPWGEIKLQYDDNVFWDSNNEKHDFIVTLTPGISVRLPFNDNIFKFDYHADIIRYDNYTNQDAVNHFVSGELELRSNDITVNLHDNFDKVFDRPSKEDTSRVKRDDNIAGVFVKLQKERLGIQIGYDNFIRTYQSDPVYKQFNRTEHRYSLILTHQTFPKTELLFEYDFNQIRYDEPIHSDSDYHQLLVGAIGKLTQKTTATIKTGYQFSNYKNAGNPNFESWVLYADIMHQFSDKNSLKLSFLRTAYESTYLTNNYYNVDSVSGTFDHYFTPKLLGFINGLYQQNDYPKDVIVSGETKKRRDSYYSLGTGLRYYIKNWLTFTLELEHIVRDSNISSFNFKDNLVTFTTRAVF